MRLARVINNSVALLVLDMLSKAMPMFVFPLMVRALGAAPAVEVAFPDLNLTARLDASSDRRSLWWSWVKELSRYDALCRIHQHEPSRRRFFVLTLEELRQLVANGMFVGAHTLSHPVLAQASADGAWSEIAESRQALEAALCKPVWAMAYPFGDPASAGVREFEVTERAGYKCAFLNCGGGFPANMPRFAIPRVHVTSDMTLGEFEAHISGFHDRLKQCLPNGILLLTPVCDSGSAHGRDHQRSKPARIQCKRSGHLLCGFGLFKPV
jgi:hypothetical protein